MDRRSVRWKSNPALSRWRGRPGICEPFDTSSLPSPTISGRRRVVLEHRVIRAVRRELVLEGRLEVGVLHPPIHPIQPLGQAQLDARATRVGHVVEKAHIGLRAAGGLEQDIVAVRGQEDTGMPLQSPARRPARAQLEAAGNDLIERRIRQERVRQAAGRIFARAGQFHRRWRARRLRPAGVQRRRVGQPPGQSSRGIEATEAMRSIEFRALAGSILQP